MSRYSAVGEPRLTEYARIHNGDSVEHPRAFMEVSHTPETYTPIWSSETLSGYDTSYLKRLADRGHKKAESLAVAQTAHRINGIRSTAIALDEARRAFEETPEGSPYTLFATHPEEHVITDAFSDPSMTHSIGMLGAMAHMDINEDGGSRKLTASPSLSKHSSPLTQHAIKRGLPIQAHPANPDAIRTNIATFRPMTMAPEMLKSHEQHYPPLSEAQVGEVRAHLRTLLRGAPTRRPDAVSVNTPRFRKPMLPGL